MRALQGATTMDKDRIAGSAKDFAGKVEGAVGDAMGDAQTQAAGRAREAAGSVQNLYGQAKDAARDAGDAAVNASLGEESSGKSAWRASDRGRNWLCTGLVDDASTAAPAAALALLEPSRF
jgi:uncharacterized protein YjbJ (UPF0337 family)